MPHVIRAKVEAEAVSTILPDGKNVRTLSVAQIEELASRLGTDGKTIEITALENEILPERYLRNFSSFTPSDQIRLLKSSVAVVGLGGLGGTVTEWIARAGVGHLDLIDGDRFEDHNLNRQLLCTQNRLGASKARAAADRVARVNSSLTIRAHAETLTAQNAARLINGCHVAVDCLDNISSRFIVEQAARSAGVPFISAAVAGLTGHITTVYPQDKGLELIYGPMEDLRQDRGIETAIGNLPQTVGLLASLESAEVINVLLGRGEDRLLRNRMLMVDLSTHTYEILRLL